MPNLCMTEDHYTGVELCLPTLVLGDIWASSWDYGTFRPPYTHFSYAHALPSRCLIFGRTLCLLPYFMCANSEGSGETARMRRLAWAFAGRLCDKYHNLMSWLVLFLPWLSIHPTLCLSVTKLCPLCNLKTVQDIFMKLQSSYIYKYQPTLDDVQSTRTITLGYIFCFIMPLWTL